MLKYVVIPEKTLYTSIIKRFGDKYELFEEAKVYPECKTYTKRVDLLFRHKKTGRFTAVEAKVSNWKRALRQALLDSSYCHFCYVAVPSAVIPNLDKDVFRKMGVGILSIEKDVCSVNIKSRFFCPIKKRWKNEVLHSLQRTRR